MEARVVKELYERVVKEFFDVFALARLRRKALTGYGLMLAARREFDVILSPKTVYTKLYRLELQGLLERRDLERKRFQLTADGKKTIKAITDSQNKAIELLKGFLGIINNDRGKRQDALREL